MLKDEPVSPLRQLLGQLAQFAVASAAAFWFFLGNEEESPRVKVLGCLIVGFLAAYAATWLYVLARHGWQAARSMGRATNRFD
jgi:hypothetical protein